MPTTTGESEMENLGADPTAPALQPPAPGDSPAPNPTAPNLLAPENVPAQNPLGTGVDKSIDKLKEANTNLQQLISNRISVTQQFTNLYFVFQGIVFASILSPSTDLKCKMKWALFILSLLASIFNFLAVWENIYMSLKYYEEMTKNWEELDKKRLPQRPNDPRPAVKPYEHRIKRCYAMFYTTLLLLAVFTVVALYGCFQIECNVGKKVECEFHIK